MFSFRILVSLGTSIAMLLISGCATIPSEAPEVYHDAQASIGRMEKKNVAKFFPNATERAKISLDTAVSLYEESQEKNQMWH